jgi:hypothetical protein
MGVSIGAMMASQATSAYLATLTVTSATLVTTAMYTAGQIAVMSGIAGMVVASALAPKQATAEDQGVMVNKASNNASLPVIYGYRKVGGTRVYLEATGSKNQFLHVIIAMSEGEINSFENIYINDVISTDERFDDVLEIHKHTGADDQLGNGTLRGRVDNWTSLHRLRGTAYLYAQLEYDVDSYPQGLPTITAEIKGVKVYDPRSTNTTFSDNPALCIRDYLTNSRYGRGIDTALIDDTSFIASANYCDTSVIIGNTAKTRYTCNGIVNTETGSMDVIRSLLTSCKGFLIFSGGKYKLIIDKIESAGFTFSEDNIVGAWSIAMGDKNSQFNRIRTNFINPDRNWQPDIAVVESTALRTLDNGLLLERTLDLPFTTDIDRAKMISTMFINQSRQQVKVEFTATIYALRAEVGDVVFIKHKTPAWDTLNAGQGKKFRIMKMVLQNNDEVRVSVLEYDTTVYDYGVIGVSDSSPNTNLPDSTRSTPPTSLTAYEEMYVTNTSQGAQIKANLSWSSPSDAFVKKFEVEYREIGQVWEFVTTTKNNHAQIVNLKAGNYEFRVRSVNTNGVRSRWAYTGALGFAGLTTPPAVIDNFSIRALDGSAHIQWSKSSVIDVLHGGNIRIRHTPSVSGATWDSGTDIGEALAGNATNVVLPLLSGTYLAKTIDSAGNFSTDFVKSITTVPNILDFNVVETITEHPAFNGVMESVVKTGAIIKLDSIAGQNSLLTEDNDIIIAEWQEMVNITTASANTGWNEIDTTSVEWDGTGDTLDFITVADLEDGVEYDITLTISDYTGTGTVGISGLNLSTSAIESAGNQTITTTFTSLGGNVYGFGRIGNTATLKISISEVNTNFNQITREVLAEAGTASSGTYYFDNSVDLGSVYTSRVTSNLQASGVVSTDLLDDRTTDIDDWGNFDGEPSDSTTAQLQIRTTNVDPSLDDWDDWSPIMVGDYNARGYEFRLILTSGDPMRNIEVTNLAVNVDMPDRNEKDSDVTVPIGGLIIAYDNAFKNEPMVGITARNLLSGDRYSLYNDDSDGFTIQIYNSADASIAGNINWIATGYGRAD